jgi:ribosomal protein S27E
MWSLRAINAKPADPVREADTKRSGFLCRDLPDCVVDAIVFSKSGLVVKNDAGCGVRWLFF